MKYKTTIAVLCVLLIAVCSIAIGKYSQSEQKSFGMVDTFIVREGVLNTSTTTIGASPTLLSATSTGRLGFSACNHASTTTNQAYISFSSATSSLQASTSIQVGEGYEVENGECFSMVRDAGFLYTGSIFVIASSSTSTFSIMER